MDLNNETVVAVKKWNNNNFHLPISHRNFLSLAKKFNKAVTKSFRTKEVNTVFKVYETYEQIGATIDRSANNEEGISFKINKEKKDRILLTENIADITKELFNKASLVEIHITPKDLIKNRPCTEATAKIKDSGKRFASFQIVG